MEKMDYISISTSPRKYKKSLYKENMEWLEKKNAKLVSERAKKLADEVFNRKKMKPKINKMSERMANQSNFNERQKCFTERKKRNRKEIKKDIAKNYTHTPRINTKSKKMESKIQTEYINKRDNRSKSKRPKTEPLGIQEVDGGIIVSGFYLDYEDLEAMNQKNIEVFNQGIEMDGYNKKKERNGVSAIKDFLDKIDNNEEDDVGFYNSGSVEKVPLKKKKKRRLKKRVKKGEGFSRSPIKSKKNKEREVDRERSTSKKKVRGKSKSDVSGRSRKSYGKVAVSEFGRD